ncbi:MAG TPA: MarR family winged helix-turn-helix transcriptional regulator [Bacillota bacterium]|nr:MarR family winged helix-turn-helix transcriptional regulator [Bacillota bacterium]
MERKIQDIKQFNRFYLRMMGLFSMYTDVSSYSATEAMILYEISHTKNCTASYLTNYFNFDKGYISRIIRKFSRNNVIKRRPSEEDRRVQYIELTEKGRDVLEELSFKADENVQHMIKHVDENDVTKLIKAMKQIELILNNNNKG